jgi:hypothetical protein
LWLFFIRGRVIADQQTLEKSTAHDRSKLIREQLAGTPKMLEKTTPPFEFAD